MLFRNYDLEAITALEKVRTGNYGLDDEWGYCEDDTACIYDEDDLADLECDEYISEVGW